MALTPKEREQIIEEETLRYETRRNLHCEHCKRGRVRWPWILAGAILVWLCFRWVFCGVGMGGYCHSGMRGHMAYGRHCQSQSMMQPEAEEAPEAQAPAPKK